MGVIKIGIIGTGRIARRFVPECGKVNGTRVTSVYNPHFESAKRFANEFGLDAYDDIDNFYSGLDAVYVAAPHELHISYIRSALLAGKHVISEKPMSFSVADSKEVFVMAEDHGLVLMEGIKTFYCPGFTRVISLVKEGAIGQVVNVEACFTKLVEADSREMTDLKYGGSFTELGSYVMLALLEFLGPDVEKWDFNFDSIKNDNNIDIFTRLSVKVVDMVEDGTDTKLGCGFCGLGAKSDGSLIIAGTSGYIRVRAPWWLTSHIEVHHEDPTQIESYEEEFLGDGLRYEINEFVNAIAGDEAALIKLDTAKDYSMGITWIMERFLRSRCLLYGNVVVW